MSPKELPPGNFQSSSLEPNKGSTTFAKTTYPPETKFPQGDARNEVFYQPARPVPVERPVTVEPPTSRKALLGRLAASLAIIATMGGGLGVQRHIEAQEELSLPGIGRDIGAIPQTAEKDYHLLLQKVGAEIVVPTVFDSSLWGKQQGLINGINSRPATKEEIQKLLNQNLPVFEEPKAPTHPLRDPAERKDYYEGLPTIPVLMPVDLNRAQRVDVTKRNGDNGVYYNFIITGDDVPFYIPLIPGTKKVETTRSPYGGTVGNLGFVYFLNDGRTLFGSIALGRGNYSPSGAKDIPRDRDWRKGEGKEFDLSQTSLVDIFHTSGTSSIDLMFITVHKNENGVYVAGPSLNQSFIKNNGEISFAPTLK